MPKPERICKVSENNSAVIFRRSVCEGIGGYTGESTHSVHEREKCNLITEIREN